MELNDYDDTFVNPEWNENFDSESIQSAILQILEAVGARPERDGLNNTPMRVSRMYAVTGWI